MKESPFRLYYNLDTGFLAFAEGIRALIVQPIGEGRGRLQALPGSTAPETITPQTQTQTPVKPEEKTEEDLFKSFDFGQ
jgi:hypothetical protein